MPLQKKQQISHPTAIHPDKRYSLLFSMLHKETHMCELHPSHTALTHKHQACLVLLLSLACSPFFLINGR